MFSPVTCNPTATGSATGTGTSTGTATATGSATGSATGTLTCPILGGIDGSDAESVCCPVPVSSCTDMVGGDVGGDIGVYAIGVDEVIIFCALPIASNRRFFSSSFVLPCTSIISKSVFNLLK